MSILDKHGNVVTKRRYLWEQITEEIGVLTSDDVTMVFTALYILYLFTVLPFAWYMGAEGGTVLALAFAPIPVGIALFGFIVVVVAPCVWVYGRLQLYNELKESEEDKLQQVGKGSER